ncbi:13157_t:CDS:1, partial [Racocetra persica]
SDLRKRVELALRSSLVERFLMIMEPMFDNINFELQELRFFIKQHKL